MKSYNLLLAAFLLVSCLNLGSEKSGLEGKPLPSFSLFLIDSSTIFNTNKIKNGRPAVLFYFAPHCPYSRRQMETIIKDIKKLANIQFIILTGSSFSEMKDFYNYYHLDKYSNITVGLDYAFSFESYFRPSGVPYMAIYGKNKRLNRVFLGRITSKQLKKATEDKMD